MIKMSKQFKVKNLILLSSIFAVLTGCSVYPEKFSQSQISERANENLNLLIEQSPPIISKIDLSDAIARAIKHNREHRLKALESVLSQGQLDINNFDMLPSLVAKAGYSERSNYAASASTTFVDDKPQPLPSPPSYSVSQDKVSSTQNIGFTWDILDFGLSYIRAKQQADRYLIAKERERKVVHNIVQDVRKSYFRAVSADKLLQKIEPLMKEASSALADAEKIEQVRAQSPMEALSYQRNLLEVLRTLQALRQDLLTAKTDLSRLMGVKPGQSFKLASFDEIEYKDMSIPFDLEFMEKAAIEKRPELIEAQYRERITLEETKAAMTRLLPGISLSAGAYYDDNAYLLNNDWQGIGAQVSWNLLNIFNVSNVDKVNELNKTLVKEQAIASSMAVISQVHISNIRFYESKKNFKIADQYYEVSKRIGEQAEIANQMQNMGELSLIREKMNELLAELRRDVAYSDMQNSFGEIFTSIGLDLIDSGYKDKNLNTLSKEIDTKIQGWKQGSFTFDGSLADEMSKSKARIAQKNKPIVKPLPTEEATAQNQVEVLAEPKDELGIANINFDLDSRQVTETEELDQYLKKAIELGYKKVVITPYASKDTDKVNLPESYNRRLVMRRGMAVKRHIESLGLPLYIDMNILEGDAIYKGRVAEIKAEK